MLSNITSRFVRFLGTALSWVVVCVLFLFIVFGTYAIWDVYSVVESASPAQYEVFKPKKDNSLSFAELQEKNPDVFGWVTVYGTHIDYPLVQADDNAKYLKTSSEGKYSLSGSIFLDYRNNKDLSDFSNIIYGHHMQYHAMFGDIGEFEDKAYFESHPYGEIYVDGKTYGLEFFAFIETDAYHTNLFDPALGEEQKAAYLSEIKERALYERENNVTTQDRLVLLTTCTFAFSNGRHLLAAKLTDEVFENTFGDEDATKTVDSIDAAFEQNSDIMPLMALGLLIILVLIAAMLIAKTQRREIHTIDETKELGNSKGDKTI